MQIECEKWLIETRINNHVRSIENMQILYKSIPTELAYNRDVFVIICPWHELFRQREF